MFELEKLESIDVIVPKDSGAITEVMKNLSEFKGNVIIDLREGVLLSESDIDALDLIADNKAEGEKSFALCNVIGENKSNIEKRYEDEIIVVPTLNEAVDFVYMEEQEREFGL